MGLQSTWCCRSEVTGSVEGGLRGERGGPRPHIPCTRLIHGCVELEGLLEVVETDHRLVERAHLNAAPVAGEAEGLRGLWAQHLVRAPPHPRQAPEEELRPGQTHGSQKPSRTCWDKSAEGMAECQVLLGSP